MILHGSKVYIEKKILLFYFVYLLFHSLGNVLRRKEVCFILYSRLNVS